MEMDWTHVTAPRRNEQAWLTSRYGRCSMTKSTPRISRVLRMLSRCLFGAAWPTSRDATSLEQSVINRHSLCQSLYQSTSLNSPYHMPFSKLATPVPTAAMRQCWCQVHVTSGAMHCNIMSLNPLSWVWRPTRHITHHFTDGSYQLVFSTSLLTDTKHPTFSTSHLTDTRHPAFSTSHLTFSTSHLTDTKHPAFSTSHLTDTKHPAFSTSHLTDIDKLNITTTNNNTTTTQNTNIYTNYIK